ncbi:hypothetical protein K458DRAFT_412230 [Lentithecium fluviatile CBS 122367]|uniref:Uncharacterized protein n=1 Tax=Lentithecium fluviatile CBS 122367 TaxID=1168545 RepID=A0A6G1JK04_9PLEO|nr:hypothetical protein K458DRAFT_412230 [Lentithecium fluviatile CBS 122367]
MTGVFIKWLSLPAPARAESLEVQIRFFDHRLVRNGEQFNRHRPIPLPPSDPRASRLGSICLQTGINSTLRALFSGWPRASSPFNRDTLQTLIGPRQLRVVLRTDSLPGFHWSYTAFVKYHDPENEVVAAIHPVNALQETRSFIRGRIMQEDMLPLCADECVIAVEDFVVYKGVVYENAAGERRVENASFDYEIPVDQLFKP